jgi:hypothetical protein
VRRTGKTAPTAPEHQAIAVAIRHDPLRSVGRRPSSSKPREQVLSQNLSVAQTNDRPMFAACPTSEVSVDHAAVLAEQQ